MKHKNDAALSKGDKVKMTAENTNMHKLMKMGMATKFEALAREALERPAERDAFAYGRAVGLHAGLEHAKSVLLNLIDEKERKDFNL